MRTVRFDPATLTDADALAWWKQWQVRADKATDQVLQRWSAWYRQPLDAHGRRALPFEPGLRQPLWSELKEWLNEHVYHERCAYCEGPLDSDRYGGDAEHFRPKGRVTFRDAAAGTAIAKCALPDGSVVDHPGYFWLAYDWRNLVPACARCNSGFGKVDQFPVGGAHVFHVDDAAGGFTVGQAPPRPDGLEAPEVQRTYFLPPARLDRLESPLLLNPLNPAPEREPSRHLRYGVGGLVVALDDSPLGSMSIEVYKLKREALRRRRQEAQESLQLAYYSAMQRGTAAIDEAERALAPYRSGEKDFSTAALDWLSELQQRSQRLLKIRTQGAA